MPAPFLAGLPATARAAFPFVVSGVRRGMSGRAIERSIRRAGLPISRGRSINPMMKQLRTLEAQGAAVGRLSSSARINTRRLPPAVTDIMEQYSYRVLRWQRIGDSILKEYVTVATDRNDLTRGQIEGMARQASEYRDIDPGADEIGFDLEHGMQRADFADFNVSRAGYVNRII